MTKYVMPLSKGISFTIMSRRGWSDGVWRWEKIKAIMRWSLDEKSPCLLVLHTKMGIMKFKINTIVIVKLIGRN